MSTWSSKSFFASLTVAASAGGGGGGGSGWAECVWEDDSRMKQCHMCESLFNLFNRLVDAVCWLV